MERKQYIDFMKGIAIIGVIITHIATERIAEDNGLFELAIYESFYGIIRFAVPFFFMVTGYLMLNPEKELTLKKLYLNYVLRIIVAASVYGIIYKIIRVILDGSYDRVWGFIKSYAVDFVTGNLEFHFWYVYAIIGVYIAMPVLKAFVKSSNRRLLEYFLLIWIICNMFFVASKSGYLPFLSNISDGYHFVGLFVEYLGYPVLGYYLLTYDFSKKTKALIGVLGVVAVITAIILTIYDVYSYGAFRLEYMAYCSPFIIIYSSAMCIFLKGIKMNYDKIIPSFIQWLGRNTLGIYFIHMVFVILIFQAGFFNYHILSWVDMIIYTLAVLILSAAVKWVISKIPYVNRWL